MKFFSGWVCLCFTLAALTVCNSGIAASESGFRIAVKNDAGGSAEPISGRLFILIHTEAEPSPREVASMLFAASAENPRWGHYAPLFGVEVNDLRPGGVAVTGNDNVVGYPFLDFSTVPAGDYYMQAVFHVYTEVTRADGHTIKVPMDQWEGQQFHQSPGNLYSEVKQVRFDPEQGLDVALSLSHVIPPIEQAADTQFIKRLKFRSEKASAFWNHDMFVGATVRLPKSYYDHPEKTFPVLYYQGHFFEKDKFLVPDQRPDTAGAAQTAYDAWAADDAAQLIVVTLMHPTPYYNNSYAVNTANMGPYGDVLMEELLPAVEERFRIIREPWARVLTGASTGGWIAAALQIYHPDFFGGAWSFCPDPVDFRRWLTVNLYEDDNVFIVPGQQWVQTEQLMSRSVEGDPYNTMRRGAQLGRALGSRQRSGEVVDLWNVIASPVAEDGYPMEAFDPVTGKINREVVLAWRNGGYDLRYYLERNWARIGKHLEGKLHFGCGAMDEFFLNLSLYRMEEFLEQTQNPYYGGWVRFVPRVGHTFSGYDPDTLAELLKEMAAHIARNAPAGGVVNP